MTKKSKLIFLVFLLLGIFSLGALLIYAYIRPDDNTPQMVITLQEEPLSIVPPNAEQDAFFVSHEIPEDVVPEEEPLPPAFSLMALGDNLMHMGVVYTGKQNDGSYDYTCLYEQMQPYLNTAAIKIINQETIMAGNQLGFSGFPYFNSPTQVGDALAEVGFNVVLQASNHSADQGIKGMESCISFWRENHPEVLMVGIHEKAEEDADPLDRIPLLEINGYTIAILNYTYGPNAGVLSSPFQGTLEVLCDWNPQNGHIDFTTLSPQVLEDISLAREMADVVIVCPHWGTEYATTPSKYQKEFALQMAEAGADVIIGAHPHVVEPIEWITAENGNRCLCYYSLGNYVSTQKDPISMLEGMAWVTFQPTEDGLVIDADKTGVIPLVCHYTRSPVRIENVYPLEEYTPEQCEKHGIRSYGNAILRYDDLQKWTDELFGDFVLPIEKVLEPTN